jgi:hypothetical protein
MDYHPDLQVKVSINGFLVDSFPISFSVWGIEAVVYILRIVTMGICMCTLKPHCFLKMFSLPNFHEIRRSKMCNFG